MIFEITNHVEKNKIMLGVIFDNKFGSYKKDEKDKILSSTNEVFSFIKNMDRVYYSGELDKETEDLDESRWIAYYFNCLDELFLYMIKINGKIRIKNIKEFGEIMVKNKAPYRFWSIGFLKHELNKRGFNEEDYKDVDDKNVLIELLEQNDFNQSLSDVDKKDSNEPKQEDNTKKKKGNRRSTINQQLKAKGLWVKGCQFASNEDKEKLLEAENEEQRKEVYDKIEKKLHNIRNKISTTKTKNGKTTIKDKLESLDYDTVKKYAVKYKNDLKQVGEKPLKSDSKGQLIEKLLKIFKD